ncbi:MAG: OmpA family protein [Candidatus Electryonea clarkiae]|nr:OmpA family protein [Candidatus Electryonea clarkiae]MDP8288486.1 OmpA family protein [Candidatus Electryonea clarkiae]
MTGKTQNSEMEYKFLNLRHLVVLFFFLGLPFFTSVATTEDSLDAAEATLLALKEDRTALLSPKNIAKAEKFFKRAREGQFQNKKIESIESDLQKANDALSDALRVIETGKPIFESVLIAREDCDTAEASIYSPEILEKAEIELNDAISALESGKIEKAEQKVQESDLLFREAELKAIKVTVTGSARAAIDQAIVEEAMTFAPLTMQLAINKTDEADKILEADRDAKSEATKKVEEALFEVRHALYITGKAKEFGSLDDGYEKLFLETEGYVDRIALILNYEPRYDHGLGDPIIEIGKTFSATLDNLRSDNRRLSQVISERDQEIVELQKQLKRKRQELAALKGTIDAEKDQKKREEEIKQLETEKFERIYSAFDEEDAMVLLQDNNLILRLSSLQFHSGKSTIQPESFEILGKVISILQEFPDHVVVIEGHTDSFGGGATNQALSEERAKAVLEYILSTNPAINQAKINSKGYGESAPIASNETKEGRAANRRIEVVIKNVK